MECYTVAQAVTPSDAGNLTGGQAKALYIGVAGNVTAIVGGQAILFTAMPVGIHRIACTRVNATATAATGIVALYGA